MAQGHKRMTAAQRVDTGAYFYLGGETITTDGTSQALTIPDDASMVSIGVETGALYYAINGLLASAASPGFIPANGREVIGPLAVLTNMSVFSGAGAVAHIQYFKIV